VQLGRWFAGAAPSGVQPSVTLQQIGANCLRCGTQAFNEPLTSAIEY